MSLWSMSFSWGAAAAATTAGLKAREKVWDTGAFALNTRADECAAGVTLAPAQALHAKTEVDVNMCNKTLCRHRGHLCTC